MRDRSREQIREEKFKVPCRVGVRQFLWKLLYIVTEKIKKVWKMFASGFMYPTCTGYKYTS